MVNQSVDELNVCPNPSCRQRLPPGGNFCTRCGTALRRDRASGSQIGAIFGPPLDLGALQAQVKTRTPDQMADDVRQSNADPTDVLAWADILQDFARAEDHAIAVYSVGLHELEEHPERRAPDTNLMGAWVRLFQLLCLKGRTEEAIKAYFKAAAHGYEDPRGRVVVASQLHAVGHFAEALDILKPVFGWEGHQGRVAELPPELVTLARQLMAELLRLVASSPTTDTLARLSWFYDDALNPIPEALPNLAFSEVQRKGVDLETIKSLKCAVIFQASPDRKVWYVGFYDRTDPWTTGQSGDMGRFMIWFYVDPGTGSLRGFDVRR